MPPTLMLVDGNYLLHRILHLENFLLLRTGTGVFTGGVYGVLSGLRFYLHRFPSVDRCVYIWDGGHSQRRLVLEPAYKANRPSAHPERSDPQFLSLWSSQKEELHKMLPDFGVRDLVLPGREGDDVIARTIREFPLVHIVVVSDDLDMLQLVDQGCTVFRPIADEEITPESFQRLVGMPRSLFLLNKCIQGNAGDNVPGIEKVGKGTALKIIEEVAKDFGACPPESESDWEELITVRTVNACKRLMETDTRNRTRYQAVIDHLDRVALNVALLDVGLEQFGPGEVATIRTAVDKSQRANSSKVMGHAQRLELGSVIKGWASWFQPFERLV